MLNLAAIAAFSGGIIGSPFGQLLVALFVFGQLLAPLPRATVTILIVGILMCSLAALISHALGQHLTYPAWTAWYYAPPMAAIGLGSTWVSYTQLLTEAGNRRAKAGNASDAA